MLQPKVSYKRHRFPPSVIAYADWLYFRFPLSLRLVEEMLHRLRAIAHWRSATGAAA
jgi:transposase-like protein